jgi:Uracil phosphoribosyltransferase
MHTILRDANTAKSDFVFYADRLNRLIVEAGLGLLPFAEKTVMTPTGAAATAASWHDASGQQDFRCRGEVKRCCCTRGHHRRQDAAQFTTPHAVQYSAEQCCADKLTSPHG